MKLSSEKRHFLFTLLIFLISATITVAVTHPDFLRGKGAETHVTEMADPELIGPDKLCNVYGSVIGDFFGAGDPSTDVYSWKIFGPSDELLFERSGGDLFQSISFTFGLIGTHKVELTVSRPGMPTYSKTQEVELIRGPNVTLLPNYQLCSPASLTLTAIDPNSSNFSEYNFTWRDGEGTIIGTENSITIDEPDTYSVTLFFEDEEGEKSCEIPIQTEVTTFDDYQIISTIPFICPDNTVTFTTSSSLRGSWSYVKDNSGEEIELGSGNSILITPILDLDQPGDYEIFFTPDPISGNTCLVKKSYSLTYFPQPDYEIIDSKSSTSCSVADGSITIQALTPLDRVFVEEIGISSPPLAIGDTYTFTNLKSGAYKITGVLGGCENFLGGVVNIKDPPENLDFEIMNIEPEVCIEDGKLNGLIDIVFPSGPINGKYRLINEKGTLIRDVEIFNESAIQISVAGGDYYFELYEDEECKIPKAELINVPGLEQTSFTVPDILTICQSFELLPQSNQALGFTLILPDGTEETIVDGSPFILTMEGDYKIIGFIPDQDMVCPSSLELEVILVDPVEFEPKLIQQDCFGNRTYFADINGRDPSTVIFSWYNENDELIGTGQNMFPTSNGEFKLDVQPANSAACPIPAKSFIIDEPVLEVDVTLTNTKLCELGPGATINLSTTFFTEVTDITWRRYDATGNIEELDQFKGETEITVFEDGVYEAAVFSIIPEIGKDCELGRNSMELDFTIDRVEFNVPDSLSICETYEYIPETTQPLEFILTYPDGTTVDKSAGEAFVLDQTGTFSLYGFNPETSSPNCPEIKEFEVIVNQPIPFLPVLFSEDCNGEKIYQAELSGATVADANIFWYDANLELISTEEFLTLNTYGTFYLEVQPKGSIPCDLEPVLFEVEEPVLSLEASLVAEPLCPDAPDAAITLEADLDQVETIEWWFTDINGNQSQLTSERNKTEILAIQEGTYEVRVLNAVPCILGMDQVLILRSIDEVRPVTEESYQVCPKYDIAPTIDPGNFAAYEWYYEGNLVATSSTYRPLLTGDFELIVYSQEGCPYSTTFETIEECELKIVFPTALELGNPQKNFLIYTNYLVDELELWVFNKWGEIIFHCKNTDLINEESTCGWDGTINGENIPNGSYSIRVNYKNYEKDINEEYLGSILVIE